MKIFIVGTHEVVSYMYYYCNSVLLISAITLLMNCSERKKSTHAGQKILTLPPQ